MVQILSYAIIQEKDTGFPYFYLPGPGVFIRARRGSCTRNLQYNRELISFLPAARIIITADFSPAGEEPPGKILVFGFHSLKMEEEMYGYLFL